MKTIDDVKNFWNANPLLTGEIDNCTLGTKEWFEKFDAIKTSVFLGDTSGFYRDDQIKGKTVLDVGCGPGYWNRRLAATSCIYHGIDISESSVALALKGADIFGCSKNLAVDNAETLSSIATESIEHVISEGVIHHTPDTQACIDSIYRVLKPGGTAAISVYYKTFYLRNSLLFHSARKIAGLMRFHLKGRGREEMFNTTDPDEVVRAYDGIYNPIGKAYTTSECKRMFSNFTIENISYYYFPTRQLGLKIPDAVSWFLAKHFGLLILLEVKKP